MTKNIKIFLVAEIKNLKESPFGNIKFFLIMLIKMFKHSSVQAQKMCYKLMHEEIIKTQGNKNQSPNLVTSQINLYKSTDNRGGSLGVFTFIAY